MKKRRILAVLLIVALPYRNHLIAFGGSTEGKAWLCIFTYAITSEKALLFFPLLVPLATAADIQEELHSRYAWFLINRIGKRNYIWMKSFGVAFTGGAISVSAAGIALVVFIVICRNIPTLNTLQNISEVISITGIGFILCTNSVSRTILPQLFFPKSKAVGKPGILWKRILSFGSASDQQSSGTGFA